MPLSSYEDVARYMLKQMFVREAGHLYSDRLPSVLCGLLSYSFSFLSEDGP